MHPRCSCLLGAALLLATVSLQAAVSPNPPAAVVRHAGPPAGYVLQWADEFDGERLDETRWTYRTDSKHWSTQCRENVAVHDGCLWLQLKKEPAGGKAYTGAGVISRPLFKYGYYEARFRLPATKGWHSSFWLMKHDTSGGTGPAATNQELDICENDSVNPRRYEANTHQWNPAPHKGVGHKAVSTPDLSADFHVWGCEFTPERIVYFFDGEPVLTVDATRLAQHSDQNIWLTAIASHLGKTDAVDDRALPTFAVFDYVRYYAKK